MPVTDGVSLTCHCTGRSGFHPDLSMDFEFWVCADCDRPTETYLDAVMESL